MSKPTVLFVCQSNGGKSAMAAALMRALGDDIEVYSAGTDPADSINAEAARSCAELGADMSADQPKPVDPEIQQRADRIVVLGTNAKLSTVPGQRALVERWVPAEPGDRGLAGRERMDALRDDIATRVKTLHDEMMAGQGAITAPSQIDPGQGGGGCGCGGCGCGRA